MGEQSVRDRLRRWGFQAYDIPGLFALFDLDGSKQVDLNEFKSLMTSMEIGFKEEEIVRLFRHIDKGMTGFIDSHEFIKTLYPCEYHLVRARSNSRHMRH